MKRGYYYLLLKLVLERHRLEEMIAKYGLNDAKVVEQSERLDQIIVQIQRNNRLAV